MEDSPLFDIRHLTVAFQKNGSAIPVVDRASFFIEKGEILAIVGESGCGKSQLALALAGLSPKQAIVDKNIISKPDLTISMIFQEPLSALNPVITIGEQIREALRFPKDKKSNRTSVIDLLESVGITDAGNKYKNYPHEFSGGMRQRVLIAIAMAREPDLLLADEPTTALDVTVQRQILDLLKDINQNRGLSIVFITHDLTLLPSLADRIMVMYAGKIVETGRVESVTLYPKHPYTKRLLSAAKLQKTDDGLYESIPGVVPAPEDFPQGCRFSTRCEFAKDECHTTEPEWTEENGHGWACPYGD